MKDTLVLHHTANTNPGEQVALVKAQHRKKFGQEGAYHYFIEKRDTVEQLHDDDFIGYHAGHWLTNVRSIGICLAGDFTREQPTDFQIDALTRLIMDLQARHGIPDSRVLLHKEVKNTTCPGTNLRYRFQEHRKTILQQQLTILRRALPRAKEPRKNRIQRAIARLARLFSS